MASLDLGSPSTRKSASPHARWSEIQHRVSAIIPAAGRGRRMGGLKKPYLDLVGTPILAHTLMVFQQCPLVDEILVVAAEGDEQNCVQNVIIPYGVDKVDQVVTGGETRQESVFNGLRKLTSDTDMVIVHDGARPFVTEEMIENTLESASEWGAATVAVPVKDTIKEADDENLVLKTLNRQRLWTIQTPQTFKYDLILQAHLYARENHIRVTDDASLIEQLEIHKVKLVMGTYENIKLTTPSDLAIARAILEARRPAEKL
jgi:2-C-methyl-D-erythritol 4-phosphate cytidylyltransferase